MDGMTVDPDKDLAKVVDVAIQLSEATEATEKGVLMKNLTKLSAIYLANGGDAERMKTVLEGKVAS